jgi:hypothetical protein
MKTSVILAVLSTTLLMASPTYAQTDDEAAREMARKAQDPLGVTAGRTILLKSGNGLDISGGVYGMAAQPENSADWQLKLGLSYFFN